MKQNLFLEKNRSEFSNNVERTINVGLSTKTRLLPNDNILDEFSLFEQYNRERDECNSFRLILNVNPVCSNVLYNARTEIVLNEGSSACTLLIGEKSLAKETYASNAVNTTSPIKYMDAIRNTEYSHPKNGGFVYHCGYDIFNNHMLRKKEFIHVNKIDSGEDDGKNYNTIFDYCRDGRGKRIKQEIGIQFNKSGATDMHLYQYDTIMSMPTAFMDNCIEKDGWWGFTNPNTIEIPNNSSGNSISINRMLANNKACEFIDLYPDRSLFSFVPKFNKYRRRIEKNWDYCITYPYKIDKEKIDEVCGGEQQSMRANVKYMTNGAGQAIVECSSYFKHNLKPGNFVSFYFYKPLFSGVTEDLKLYDNKLYVEEYFDENGRIKDEANPKINIEVVFKGDNKNLIFTKYNIKIKVESVGDVNGDHTDRIFSVKYSDIREVYKYMKSFGCFYKKNNGNTDCLYYFRKFKKITVKDGEELKSDVNKVAFGRNIYGDDVAQVLFMDNINIDGLLDHNGRPLSEIYFTVVKRNAGYKEWYENKNYSGDTVEFSHCFGEVTSAIDFCGIEDEPFDYNIHYLHNIDKTSANSDTMLNTLSAWGETVLSGMPKTIESGITIDMDEFFGDIVEYDLSKAAETVIGNVYHRFNTAQRELWSEDYMDIVRDEIISDDYDNANGGGTPFSCATYFLNNVKNPVSTKSRGDQEGNLMYGNISPEGYFYNPHMKIQVRENDDTETTSPAKYINYGSVSVSADTTISAHTITFKPPVNYGFYKQDYIGFYDKKSLKTIWGEIIKVSGSEVTVRIDNDSINECKINDNDVINVDIAFSPNSGSRRFYAYWSPNNTPTYANLCEGIRKFVWREILPPSQMMQDDELYDLPFTNGRFYIEKNINFFLKRQDPIGKYGLSVPMFKVYERKVANPLLKFGINGYEPVDFSDIMYTINNVTNFCF